MGTLIAMHYDTAGGLADHTYVKCSTDNVAWGCFGGKTGGHPLRQGNGSTERANWEWSEELGVELFAHMVKSHLGQGISAHLETQLKNIRAETERKRMEIDKARHNEGLGFLEYANAFDELTITFQHQTADMLSTDQYVSLFDLQPGDTVTLADPDIISPPSRDISTDPEEDISGGPPRG